VIDEIQRQEELARRFTGGVSILQYEVNIVLCVARGFQLDQVSACRSLARDFSKLTACAPGLRPHPRTLDVRNTRTSKQPPEVMLYESKRGHAIACDRCILQLAALPHGAAIASHQHGQVALVSTCDHTGDRCAQG
jgi:hypothetical protein